VVGYGRRLQTTKGVLDAEGEGAESDPVGPPPQATIKARTTADGRIRILAGMGFLCRLL
jgi:hypothetical protein